MSHFWTIFRRELGAYFNSAIAVIFLVVFILFSNGLFMLQFFQIGKADMRSFFGSLPYILNIFIPAIAMRLWAEDKKGNTFELLLTFPMRPQELVLGKYMASLVFYMIALATTFTIPAMLWMIGQPDPGVILGGYLGAVLMGGLFLAIGIFVSGLCKDQIVAFVLTMMITFAFYFTGTDAFATVLDAWLGGAGSFIRNNLGIASHLVSFGKGVVSVRDCLYFFFMIVIFLFLNGLSLEGRFRPRAKIIFSTSVGVCLLSVLLANWLLHDMSFARFDLTQGQLYTVSDASKRVLTTLKVPAQIKLYITPSENLPTTLKTLEREISDKLEELRVISDGKLKYTVIHVDASDHDEALQTKLKNEGVVPFQVESIQRDEVGVKLIFSTLVIEYKEKPQDILPRLVPQNLGDLEYQLVSRIHKLTLDEKPKVAVFAPIEGEALGEDLEKALGESDSTKEKSYQDPYRTALSLMRNNGYEVERIALTKNSPIPEKAKLLILLEPGALSDRQRYEINRYLHDGGTVILAAQGYQYTFQRDMTGVLAVPKQNKLDINQLIEKWGLKINQDYLFDMNSQVISLSSGQRIGPFALEMPVKFPNQIIVDESAINRSYSLTKRVPSLAYLWGSALELAQDTMKSKDLKSTVLFTSSPKSWTSAYTGENLSDANTQPPKEMKGPYPLAVMVEGKFLDAYGGSVPGWTADEKAETKALPDAKPGRLMVIGCSKVFSEDLIQNPGNLNLYANLVDGLVLGDDLIQIRSKIAIMRDLKHLRNAEKLWFRFFTVLLVPILLFIAALIRHMIRKKEKEFYLAALHSAQSDR